MVRVAVEALHQQDMDKLELGLSRLYQADPAIEVMHPYLYLYLYLSLTLLLAATGALSLSLPHANELTSKKPV